MQRNNFKPTEEKFILYSEKKDKYKVLRSGKNLGIYDSIDEAIVARDNGCPLEELKDYIVEKKGGKYRVRTIKDGKLISLGTYDHLETAHKAGRLGQKIYTIESEIPKYGYRKHRGNFKVYIRFEDVEYNLGSYPSLELADYTIESFKKIIEKDGFEHFKKSYIPGGIPGIYSEVLGHLKEIETYESLYNLSIVLKWFIEKESKLIGKSIVEKP